MHLPYRGYSFPVVLKRAGHFTPAEGLETIVASIIQIVGTRKGERVHNPRFGCRVWELVFDQLDPIFDDLAREFVSDALKEFEPRVSVVATTVNRIAEKNQAQLVIHFRTPDLAQPTQLAFLFQLAQSGIPLGILSVRQ